MNSVSNSSTASNCIRNEQQIGLNTMEVKNMHTNLERRVDGRKVSWHPDKSSMSSAGVSTKVAAAMDVSELRARDNNCSVLRPASDPCRGWTVR